ncbi:hypothetical protein HXY32_01850 [Candidatus Bathyarchaeota archaeon]|nr:hypothetical protein [Candidatus Bathyarchaeota archaeon]
MRAYGFKEDYYREAATKGVLFINYEDKRKPQVRSESAKIKVSFWEPVLNEEIELEPDLLVLSAATIPNPDNKRIAEMLKVPLTKDGFFLEAYMKLGPVDFATEGVFLCGMAHSPKYMMKAFPKPVQPRQEQLPYSRNLRLRWKELWQTLTKIYVVVVGFVNIYVPTVP